VLVGVCLVLAGVVELPGQSPKLTLEEAIARANRVQPSVISAAGTVRNAQARQRSASGAFLPNLNVNASRGTSFSEGQQLDPSTEGGQRNLHWPTNQLYVASPAGAARDGISVNGFPRGTIISIGLHPLRNGFAGGGRGKSGLFKCPPDTPPQPGKHCDSVQGSTSHGEGVLPEPTGEAPAQPKR